MISFKFQNIFIFCFYILNLKTILSQNIEFQSNISAASLTGAYRPPEISLNYTIISKRYHCRNSLAKYVVSLRKSENEENFGYTHFCGGVIIDTNLILTAAHCVISNKEVMRPSSIKVVAKTPLRLNKTPYSQILRVRKIIIHELFSFNAHDFDIALLKLREHIKLDKKCASVIALPQYSINNFTLCSVLGWGRLFLYGPMANEILQLNVTLHSKDLCRMIISDIGKAKICASDLMDYEKNPCSGDSGGPLICEGYLTGIVSFGYYCGLGLPTVYTEVYEYLKWIERNNAEELKILKKVLPFIMMFWMMVCFML